MEVIDLEISEVKLIKPKVFPDARGFFQQTYHEKQYRNAGFDIRFVQDNWSRSTNGVLRGLHYQLNHAQDKLVYVTRGKVFGVAVDIRQRSPTFGKWVGTILSEENFYQMFIPKGFAHGFCALSDKVDFIYKCSDFYTPGDEYGIRWDDPAIGIHWPKTDFLVLEKDRQSPLLKNVSANHLPVYGVKT